MLKIIGLGNILRGDDGIGPAVIEELRTVKFTFPIELIDAGGDAFNILDQMISKQPLILIDCARMGEKPGEIVTFKLDQVNLKWAEQIVLLHGFGLSEIYQMAQHLGADAECTIIAVEPKSIEFNTGLSQEIRMSIPRIIQTVIQESKNYAQKNINN